MKQILIVYNRRGTHFAVGYDGGGGHIVKKIKYRNGYYEVSFENYPITTREHEPAHVIYGNKKKFEMIQAEAEAKAKAEAEENQKKANLKLVPNTGNRKSRRTKNKIK